MTEFFSAIRARQFWKKEIAFLEEVITRSANVKARVVSEDEKETKGRRMILNYGHTFAHGFEAASKYRLSHGEAVSIGMIAAARLARYLKLFGVREEARQFELIRALSLRTSLASLRLKTKAILAAMMKDKKKKAGRLRFILPVKIGSVVVRDQVAPSLVHQVIREVGSRP